MKNESVVKECSEIKNKLKTELPSFEAVPYPPNLKTEMEDKNIICAFNITSGKYDRYTIVLRNIVMEGDNLTVNYFGIDSTSNIVVDDDDLGKLAGQIVYFFLIEEVLKKSA